MKAINFVVVGYGGMGSYHVAELMPAEQDKIQVIGTFDIKTERQQAAAAQGLKAYASFEAVLQDPQVEAILIATPNDAHKDLAVAALKAGKHVISEKPVAMNVAELDEILAVAQAHERVFMVHQNRRWDPDFLIIRDLYQKRQIGELFQIESRVHGANGIPGDWRHLKAQGGGMLLDWGVHLFDQILWLVDSPIKEIHTDLSYVLGDEVDDGFFTSILFENGLRALIEVGTTNYTQLPRWYVKGYEGTAKIDDWDLSGEIIRATGNTAAQAPVPIQAGVGLTKTMAPPSEEAMERIAFPEAKAEYPSFYGNFYQVVRENAEPLIKNSEVRKVLQVMEDILNQG
ncbi:scyllo-inositol 2-dehydrogenase (NADP+) [Enterococcus sp. PF1-24]|uniref:Gfo/Idh/MocA family protein n=1 Tax=unclassified Enterococcus TaxID=2608891 RepID=UPI00247342FD|nr:MULTISPECIES: Gfo/Idh/MocA family oxidoreductase [unclassified Enterococcus]MDH6363443.1 scyllo-inositol 2-dehydrogenase (NADP+) [Enterococcus sp. PFB1-1]MDH6400537.1 scyllo-inositol 2-dehydrogenase (NADP+) [Enterococcus sp. PF1-24]